MTITASAIRFDTAEMSVVAPNLVVRKEVKYMTTATALDRLIDAPEASRNRAHGIDRAVQRLAVAMLEWSRTRAERNAETHQEHSHRLQESSSTLRREADALRLTQRIGL
jgi:hypothetical protein|uniref:hypothetical protein n=1 Tax=Terrimesophilobacter sp. TaxID=2906435 RepID=UPI002F922977